MLNYLSLNKNFVRLVSIFVMSGFFNFCWSQVQTTKPNNQVSDFSKEIKNARELIGLGRLNEAQQIISSQLGKKPRDAQWRYLDAVLDAEFAIIDQNEGVKSFSSIKLKLDKAIEKFERFTEEFPELSEPFNNLSVLYLRSGQADRSRESLERAIINNPNYELAYENLGDLYIYLANITYNKGLSKLPKSSRLSKKLDHLNQMPFLAKPNIIRELKQK